jgi:hypothetical protein
MIPPPLIAAGKVAGGFIAQHWRTLVVVWLVLAVLAFCYVSGRNHERAVWKPQLEQMKAAHAAASAQAEADRAAVEAAAKARTTEIVAHYQERIHAKDTALAAALERVQHAARVRPLAPAAAAPAACRDYEAGPEQLSPAHREFLVRLGSDADRVAEQLTACQQYAVSLHQQCSALPTE